MSTFRGRIAHHLHKRAPPLPRLISTAHLIVRLTQSHLIAGDCLLSDNGFNYDIPLLNSANSDRRSVQVNQAQTFSQQSLDVFTYRNYVVSQIQIILT